MTGDPVRPLSGTQARPPGKGHVRSPSAWRRLGGTAAMLALLCGCVTTGGGGKSAAKGGAKSKWTLVQGRKAPAFTLSDLNGNERTLREFRGKVVLLNFWASWCEPCKIEFPHLDRLQQTLGPKGLVVLAVNVDEASAQAGVAPMIRRYGYRFTVLLDAESRVINMYNPSRNCPYTAMIDRTGLIRVTHQGYRAGDEVALERYARSLLKEGRGKGSPKKARRTGPKS